MSYKDFRSQTNAFKAMGGLAEFHRQDYDVWEAGVNEIRKARLEAKGPVEIRKHSAIRFDGSEPVLGIWESLWERNADGSWTYLAGYNISWPCPPLCS